MAVRTQDKTSAAARAPDQHAARYGRNGRGQEMVSHQLDRAIELLQQARDAFLDREGVLGVGYGPKERNGQILVDEPSIIVYVTQKKATGDLPRGQAVEVQFHGVPTDVVEVGQRTEPFYRDYDMRWIDWGKVHEANPNRDVGIEPAVDFDLDHVAVLEIDDTFVSGSTID